MMSHMSPATLHQFTPFCRSLPLRPARVDGVGKEKRIPINAETRWGCRLQNFQDRSSHYVLDVLRECVKIHGLFAWCSEVVRGRRPATVHNGASCVVSASHEPEDLASSVIGMIHVGCRPMRKAV